MAEETLQAHDTNKIGRLSKSDQENVVKYYSNWIWCSLKRKSNLAPNKPWPKMKEPKVRDFVYQQLKRVS